MKFTPMHVFLCMGRNIFHALNTYTYLPLWLREGEIVIYKIPLVLVGADKLTNHLHLLYC